MRLSRDGLKYTIGHSSASGFTFTIEWLLQLCPVTCPSMGNIEFPQLYADSGNLTSNRVWE